MRIFYDTEFLEDGRTIELISIGMVADDGRELYAVNRDAPWDRIREHDWLLTNVVPHLPRVRGDGSQLINFTDPLVKPRAAIAAEVLAFIRATPNPDLWAWYCAYDHVALCQLFGRMVDLPPEVPMWTNDLQQVIVRAQSPDLPDQQSGVHDALADARHAQRIAAFLERQTGRSL
ncbi:hypothetical protein [Micromonospora sp. NPDC049679]|uniref:hypothetical protein n=1 Tax=Micromonospora sp. NPDC049679 TaxID=3155920 RepID=UPI0033E1782F